MRYLGTEFLALSLILSLIAGPPLVLAQETEEAIPTETATEPMPEVPLTSTPEEALPPVEEAATSTEESAAIVEAPTTTPTEIIDISAIDPSSYVPGEVVVKFEDESTAVVATDDASVVETVAALSQDSDVEYAEPNFIRSLDAIASSTDPDAYRLWALENIGQDIGFGLIGTPDADVDAEEAWQVSTGSGTIVAVIDTGVDYTHPDLMANMWDGTSCVDGNGDAIPGGCRHGYDFADNDNDPMPVTASTSYDHGTHVAGIIAAAHNNGEGGIGIAPDTKIMALRFGLDTGSEVEAIRFAMKNGAKIINASFSGSGYSQAEYDAIKEFQDAGGIFVASAANGAAPEKVGDDTVSIGDDLDNLPYTEISDPDTGTVNKIYPATSTPAYPAMHDLGGIITVAATDMDDALTRFSNYGKASVDLAAPGYFIWSTVPTGDDSPYAFRSGTSMATPLVAGVVALIEAKYPSLDRQAVKEAVLDGDQVAALAEKTVSGSRLNAYKALQHATPPPAPEKVEVKKKKHRGGGGGGGGGSRKEQPVSRSTTGQVLGATTMTDAERQALIAQLMEQVRILMQKLLALQAAGL